MGFTHGPVAALRDLGVDIDYEEGPGVHDWAFWDAWIQRALQWMGFPVEPPPLQISRR